MNKNVLRRCLQQAQIKVSPETHPCWELKSQHVSFVVQYNKILGFGYNRVRGMDDYHQIHAEWDAYCKVRGILDHNKRWDMINVRITRGGRIAISAPCHKCHSMLVDLGCKSVYFTLNNGLWAKTILT